jgi:signal transduction histidine kinase
MMIQEISTPFISIRALYHVVRLVLAAALLLLLLISGLTAQHSVVLLDNGEKEYMLGKHLEYIEDYQGTLNFRDVQTGRASPQFAAFVGSVPNFGFTRSAFWFRWRMRPSVSLQTSWMLEIPNPHLGIVDLYEPQHNGEYLHRRAGYNVAFSERPIEHRNIIFPLSSSVLQAGDTTQYYYLRVASPITNVSIPLIIVSAQRLIESIYVSQAAFGLFYGIMFGLLAYNLFVFFSLRDFTYLIYTAYIFSLTFNFMYINGFSLQVLFRTVPAWEYYAGYISEGVVPVTSLLFTIVFLNTRHYTPRLHWLLWFWIGLTLVTTALVMNGNISRSWVIVRNLLVPVIIMVTAVLCQIRGQGAARFLIIAFALIWSHAIIFLLKVLALLPVNLWTQHGYQASAAVAVIVLSLALADRINILRKEKLQAQESASQQQQLMIQMLQESEQVLERQVAERTHDLQAANEEIQRQMFIQAEQAREIEIANSQLEELNSVLQTQNRELTEVNTEKNELMGIVAHDLKNPIGAVLGLAEMIQSGVVENNDIPKVAENIVRTAERMSDLVRNVLDVNRLEQGGMHLYFVTFDITSLVESVVWQYQAPAEAKQITPHFHAEATEEFPALIHADEQALSQVLDNLVSNAVKYSPQGKNIFVRVIRTEYSVRVEVQDEGPGISAEDQKRLFGKFARLSAQPTGGEHSTGLGLSIVKKLVEAMNGRVWCESELDKGIPGATFIVELPAAKQVEFVQHSV